MDIVIFGTGGHCRSVIDVIESKGDYNILGLVNISTEASYPIGLILNDYRVMGHIGDLKQLKKLDCDFFIAVGDNHTREMIYHKIIEQIPTAKFATLIHKSASVSRRALLGEDSIVMANAVVNAYAKIGKHCLINSGAIVEHDCTLDDFVTMAPGSKLGGTVTIGKSSVVSIGATVKHNVTIGEHVVIGAQSYVNKDVSCNVCGYGVPFKVNRTRTPGEKYL